MPKAYLSLGSNLGNRKGYLRAALKVLGTHKNIKVLKVSSVYETEPEGKVSQRKFYNLVVEIKTTLTPEELLEVCQLIESLLKRKRRIPQGPRTIDVDILLYGDAAVTRDNLIIPHPRLHLRAFVLVPLAEIVPHLKLSGGKRVDDHKSLLASSTVVRVGKLEG